MGEKELRKSKKVWIFVLVLMGLAMLGGGGFLAYSNFVKKSYLVCVAGIALALVGVILIIYLIYCYNKFVRYSNKVDESLSSIDVHLKARFDLIPNLVNTVKGYSKHEEAVFTEIAEIRSKALETKLEKEKIDLANMALPKLKEILFIAEDYPELKADRLYRNLMEELVEVEDKIVAARRFYISNVNHYNTAIQVWPSSIIANIFGFKKREMFEIEAGERLNVNISM